MKRQKKASRRGTEARWTGFTRPSDCLRAAVRGHLLREYLLTPQQLETLECLSDGKTPPEIVGEIGCGSTRTVEGYISQLYDVLHAGDRGQLVATWLGLVYRAIDACGLHLPPDTPDRAGPRSWHDGQIARKSA